MLSSRPCLLAALACSCAAPTTRAADLEPAPDPAAQSPVGLTEEALRIHRSALVFDGHNDLPWQIRRRAGGSFDELDIAQAQPDLHTDIPRLREGGVGAQFWSVYVPAAYEHPVRDVLEQIDLVHRMVRRYPETFELAVTADDVERIHAEGRIASLIGVEGGHMMASCGAPRTWPASSGRGPTPCADGPRIARNPPCGRARRYDPGTRGGHP